MRTLLLSAAALCAASGAALGAAPSRDCAAIADPATRLACYDEKNRNTPVPPDPEPAPAPAPAPAAAAAPAEGAVAPPGADEFGMKKKTPVDELQSIKARIVGKVTYWERGTEFRLDNGQVWKAVDPDTGSYPSIPENPEVKISRGMFGAFWLEIVAVNARIKVKRIS